MQMYRCTRCMEEIGQDERVCPHCGCEQNMDDQQANALRKNTILAGRYLIGNVIGQGGFGITYVGYDLRLDMKVAVKEYFPTGTATRSAAQDSRVQWYLTDDSRQEWSKGMERFFKEAKKMARLDSVPAIVRVRDVFRENETAYIIMDFVEGVTLKSHLLGHGVLAYDECVRLLSPIFDSLEVMHEHGFIHRDISPDNIMLQPDGTVRLLDMGAAVDMNASGGHVSMAVVKRYFSAPEQYVESETVGSWTDVYSMAATIYYCLTGKLPPEAIEREFKKKPIDFDDRFGIPAHGVAALTAALELDVEKRTKSMREFKEGLEREGGADSGTAKEEETAEEEPRTESAVRQEPEAEPVEKQEMEKENDTPDEDAESQIPKEQMPETGEQKAETETGAEKQAKPDGKKKLTKKVVVSALLAVLAIGSLIAYLAANISTDAVSKENHSENILEDEENKDTYASATEDTEPGVLMEDVFDGYFLEEDYGTVLGSDYTRDEIKSVTFLDTLSNVGSHAWDVSASGNGEVMAWVEPNGEYYDLYIAGENGVSASNCGELFKGYTNVSNIRFNGAFDTGNVTDMGDMFYDCESLTSIDVSGFNTGNVTYMGDMFFNCESLTSLDVSGFNTGNVTDMYAMFDGCESLTSIDVSGLDTGNVTDMSAMFCSCKSLTSLDVSGFDTKNVTDMGYMFRSCESLTSLDVSGFNTGNVTDMGYMFCNCELLTSLDVSGFNTGNVTDMRFMFNWCKSLTSIDVSGFDIGNVTDMDGMFYGCDSLNLTDDRFR